MCSKIDRSGKLISTPLVEDTGVGGEKGGTGASYGPDHSAEPEPEDGLGPTGECSSRGPADLVSYLHRQWAWSKETFGPALRTKGIVQHITKELREIEADPHDLAEWVDVIILAMDGFWRHGGKPEDLLPAMQAKQDKNFARTWPDWRTMGEDQAIEHDRSGEPLKLKEGSYYRSGEGKIVGPMYLSRGVWYAKGGKGDWTDTGVNLHGYPANSEYFGKTDLVAEVDEGALGTDARSAETGTGSVEDEGPACKATPQATPPSPQDHPPSDPQMTVEEARQLLDGIRDPKRLAENLWRVGHGDDALNVEVALRILSSNPAAVLREPGNGGRS